MTGSARKAERRSRLAPVHQGEILLGDFMEPLGLTQYALAKALGMPVPALRIGQVVRGQRAISADTALRFSRYFGTRPERARSWGHISESDNLAAKGAGESAVLGSHLRI